MMEAIQPESTPKSNGAIRLTFSYEGRDLRLVSQETVEMIALPSDPPTEKEPRTGFWYELQTVGGRTVYRIITQNPIRYSVEVPTGSDDYPLARRIPKKLKGIFILLVPHISYAPILVLYGGLRPEGVGVAAKEIFRVDLQKSLRSEDTPPTEAKRVLDFLNAARKAEEIAGAVEFPSERNIALKIAQSLLDERSRIGKFTNLDQILAMKDVTPERFSEIVRALARKRFRGGATPR